MSFLINMYKLRLTCFIYILVTTAFCGSAKCIAKTEKYISVSSFGAKGNGLADDSKAIENAMKHCVKNNLICYLPRTLKFYNITSTIRIPLEPGESLTVKSNGAVIKPLNLTSNKSAYNLTSFREYIFLSIGKEINSIRSPLMFKFSEGTSIDISNLTFDGSNLKGKIATSTFSTDIFVGVQALAEKVQVKDCNFRSIYGYSLRIHNVKKSLITGSVFSDISGRGATMYGQKADFDGVGDAIYHALVKDNGSVEILNCKFTGKKYQNKRSRSAITFEYSTQPYKIILKDLDVKGFAKCLHIEETAKSLVSIDDVNFSDFNFAIANVLNDRSVLNVKKSRIDVGVNDGNDNGDALAFLNYQSKAKINVDSSYLNFRGKQQAYQSAVGLESVKNSTINGNGTNFFFADGSTSFINCTFVRFGGQGKSFSSNNPQSHYQLINSILVNCSAIHSKGERLTLQVKNLKSKMNP